MLTLLGLKYKEAKKETNQIPKAFESARDYLFQDVLPLV